MSLHAQAMMDGSTVEPYDPMDSQYDVNFQLPTVLPVDEDALLNRVIAKLEAGLYGPEDALTELGVPKEDQAAMIANAKDHLEQKAELALKAHPPAPTPGQRTQAGANNQPTGPQLNSPRQRGGRNGSGS